MTDERLRAISQRLRNLESQFPWKHVEGRVNYDDVAEYSVLDASGWDVAEVPLPYDAEFIAHAPLDVADLLAEVDRLRRLCRGAGVAT